MESLNSYNFVLFVLTQIILMFTVPSIISGIKYSKSDYLYITGITALSLILFNFIDSVTFNNTNYIHNYIIFQQNQMVFYFADNDLADYFILCKLHVYSYIHIYCQNR